MTFRRISVVVISFTLVALLGCGGSSSPPSNAVPAVTASAPKFALPAISPEPPHQLSAPVAAPCFEDEHERRGVEFVYETGARGLALMVESTGGGGGWIDFDEDGDADLYLIQGGDPLASSAHPIGDRLLRNVEGRFEDVTEPCRRVDQEYGQGIAVGDFDNDGFDDVFVTNVGVDRLLLNLGDGTFQDVTTAAGVGDPRWSSSAAWFDLDDDGDLDLYVCNYLTYDVHTPVSCRKPDGTPMICHPESIPPGVNECYENLGDGGFRPVAAEWGLIAPRSKSLGVAIADFDGDARPDVFVANDTQANHLFIQNGPRKFVERAVPLGCAVDQIGQFQANMGVACNDYDGNGFLDLYITHFTHESNTLFANLGSVGFHDVTRAEGLHLPTVPLLGFGTVMDDLNADGHMDIFVTNGHIDDWRHQGDLWQMRPQLFSYTGTTWVEHKSAAGDFFSREFLGRAAAMADADRDGKLDLLVVHQGAPAALLMNHSEMGSWLQVALRGIQSNRRGVGARVTVEQGGRKLVHQLVGGTSYCAAHEPILNFGLGVSSEPCTITVDWHGPLRRQTRQTVAVNQRVTLRESRGSAE